MKEKKRINLLRKCHRSSNSKNLTLHNVLFENDLGLIVQKTFKIKFY